MRCFSCQVVECISFHAAFCRESEEEPSPTVISQQTGVLSAKFPCECRTLECNARRNFCHFTKPPPPPRYRWGAWTSWKRCAPRKTKTPRHHEVIVQLFQNAIYNLVQMMCYNLMNVYLYLLSIFLLKES